MELVKNAFFNTNMWLAALGSYVLASVVFYYYPEFLHKNKKKHKEYNFVTISHRGGSGENNENTLPAFKHSFEIGVDMLELDCHITKDGQVVVIHDNNLNRLCGVNKLVSDFNYDELPPLLAEHKEDLFLDKELKRTMTSSIITNNIHNRNNNHSASSSPSNNSKRIPLLEEVFQLFPNMPINLDIKIDNSDLINKVNELIVKYDRQSITVWGSFRESVVKKCYKLNPTVSIYFSSMGCVKLLFLILTGLLPFYPLKETYFEIIMPNHLLKNKRSTLPKSMIAPFVLIKMFFVRKSLVRHLQKRGIHVFYWVLNTDEEFETAINLGANGIITDYPSKLLAFCDRYSSQSRTLIRPVNNF